MEGVLEGLAQAAQILSSGDASAVDRAGAEAAFDQLKTGEYPLEAFGVVLEAAAHPDAPDDNLLFHTATVLKVRTDVRACVRAYVPLYFSVHTHSSHSCVVSASPTQQSNTT